MKNRNAFWIITLGSGILSAALLKFFSVFPIMPVAATREAAVIDEAFQACLILTIVLFSFVLVSLGYALVFFRSKTDRDEGPQIHHSTGWRVETTWIGISLILTIGLAVFGWKALDRVYGAPDADIDVEVRAQQYSWEFFYPKFNTVASKLYLPVNKRVRILLSSKDVMHSFWVPEFRMKHTALPGKITSLKFTPTREGEYVLLCNQLCGPDHTNMTGAIEVLKAEDFDKKFTGADSTERW